MITIVHGPKGSGKTKQMIQMANEELNTAKGTVLFINDRDKYRVEVDKNIRFINSDEYRICGADELYGFISGICASNYDVNVVYIDNLLRIIDADGPKDVMLLIDKLEKLEIAKEIKFVLSLSCAENEVPEAVKKYL